MWRGLQSYEAYMWWDLFSMKAGNTGSIIIFHSKMLIQEKFINKYKEQFYTGDVSPQHLMREQRELLRMLDDLHSKTQKYFDKMCVQAQRKVQSNRTSFCKESAVKLPFLVAEAQLKNSHTYRQLLQTQKSTLQKRMAASVTLKEKDLNSCIKMEKQKMATLAKNNKVDKLEIKKLGEKLVQQSKPYSEIYDELLHEVQAKRAENGQKQAKIESINGKVTSLMQKMTQLDYLIEQKVVDAQENHKDELENGEQTEKRFKELETKREKVRKSLESVKTRLSQEYYCKLKQLETVSKKGHQLDKDIIDLQLKVEERTNQISNSRVIG